MKQGKARIAVAVVVAITAFFGAVALATSTPLPTEFTSGGVRWGDLTGDSSGFYNTSPHCGTDDVFAQGDAQLLATGQDDAFDDSGEVFVGGTGYVVPGGTNGPVDLTGETLTAPPNTTGPLTVAVQWQGAGPNTIRELVTLTNPGASDFTGPVHVITNLGSDSATSLQAQSTGSIAALDPSARWIVTSDSDTSPDDPVIVAVTGGPGSVASAPTTTRDCPPGTTANASIKEAAKAAAEGEAGVEAPNGGDESVAGSTTTSTEGDVQASGTNIGGSDFVVGYNVTIPAGATRYLMLFWSLYETNAEGVAAGPTWNTNPSEGSPRLGAFPSAAVSGFTIGKQAGAFQGLTTTQLSQVLNWSFPTAAMNTPPRFTG